MPEHSTIIDAQRHENKHASTASAGQVLRANGDGTTGFVNPSTLNNISVASTLLSQSTIAQNPTATDTPFQVVFGVDGNSDVSVASNGNITILNNGLYFITFNLNFGRTTGAGNAILMTRLLVGGIPTGLVQSFKLSDATATVPFNASLLRSFSANDIITVEILRDSSGINNGGLVTTTATLSGFGASPSAAVRVQRIGGAS